MSQSVSSFGKIGVLFGGDSAEREISLRSGRAVLNALQKQNADVVGIDVRFDQSLFEQLKAIDVAFIALHGRGGEDGVIQGVLEALKIPYTGSSVAASAIAMDKLKTKYIWTGIGLPTPEFKSVADEQSLSQLVQQMGGAVMVKPPHEGSSIGMSRATSEQELLAAYKKAQQHDEEILVERWIQGTEFTCTLLNDEALPVIRLKTPNEFYDFDAKYQSDSTEYLIPCGLSAEQENQLQELSLKAFRAIGCRGWGRVDSMMDENGQFWLLEVNTVPGMTDHSLVPMAAKAKGLAFEQLVLEILGNCGGDFHG